MEQKEWLRRNAVNLDAEYAGHVPVNSLVEYQGSIHYACGERFMVVPDQTGYRGHPGSLNLAWPDAPERIILWNVRPKSVRVIREG